MPKDKISRWWHCRNIKAWRYLFCAAASVAFFAWLAFINHDWAYIERSGGIVALFGALLGLRRLLRKGTRTLNKQNPPLFDRTRKFDMGAMWQHVEDTSDSFAQELGLILVVLGTAISSFGAPLLQVLLPLSA